MTERLETGRPSAAAIDNATLPETELYDEIAYCYDGTLEGLLCATFEAYRRHEAPTDIVRSGMLQPRLSQRIAYIETDMNKALRVKRGLIKKAGWSAFNAVRKASCSSRPDAGTAAYHFIRYAMDEHTGRAKPFSNISHPSVAPLFAITRSVDQECEHMRQFIRFEHLRDEETNIDVWYARCNPRDSVIPLVMGHFVERFNVQPFLIHDENHDICGVYDGSDWYMVDLASSDGDLPIPRHAQEEKSMQDAWRAFYRAVSIDARYNPELRRHFMAKRFWKNLTEMQEEALAPERKPSIAPTPLQYDDKPAQCRPLATKARTG